jgi:hypothetical protein
MIIAAIKRFIREQKCHHDMELIRWHWVHFPEYEPLSVEAEYKCTKCGRIDYLHLYDKKAKDWSAIMGDYKKQ